MFLYETVAEIRSSFELYFLLFCWEFDLINEIFPWSNEYFQLLNKKITYIIYHIVYVLFAHFDQLFSSSNAMFSILYLLNILMWQVLNPYPYIYWINFQNIGIILMIKIIISFILTDLNKVSRKLDYWTSIRGRP